MEWGYRKVSNHVPADKPLMDGFGREELRVAEESTVYLRGSQHSDGPGKSPTNRSCSLDLLVLQGERTREESSFHRGNPTLMPGFLIIPPKWMKAHLGLALGHSLHLMRRGFAEEVF